jgi:hypothetical protein
VPAEQGTGTPVIPAPAPQTWEATLLNLIKEVKTAESKEDLDLIEKEALLAEGNASPEEQHRASHVKSSRECNLMDQLYDALETRAKTVLSENVPRKSSGSSPNPSEPSQSSPSPPAPSPSVPVGKRNSSGSSPNPSEPSQSSSSSPSALDKCQAKMMELIEEAKEASDEMQLRAIEDSAEAEVHFALKGHGGSKEAEQQCKVLQGCVLLAVKSRKDVLALQMKLGETDNAWGPLRDLQDRLSEEYSSKKMDMTLSEKRRFLESAKEQFDDVALKSEEGKHALRVVKGQFAAPLEKEIRWAEDVQRALGPPNPFDPVLRDM